MPIGYMCTVTVLAVATALAIAPIRRPWSLGQLSWRATFLLNEQPHLAIVWLAFSTWLAFVQGDLNSPISVVAGGLAAVTTIGLCVLLARASALPPRHWRTLVTPLPLRPRSVARLRNVGYRDASADRHQLLDVYRPGNPNPDGAPLLIHFHGGGYVGGRKSWESRPLFHRLASHGWVVISADYRPSGVAPFPAQLQDARAVLAWTRANASELGADANQIVVVGSSAGAHLALMTALTEPTVAAAISLYGFFDTPGWVPVAPGADSSPRELLSEATPPLLVISGTNDTFVPVAEARSFVEAARDISRAPVEYVELPGAQHTFDLNRSIRFESVLDRIEAFATSVVVQSVAPQGLPSA